MEASINMSQSQEAKGFYKLSMLQCIGFGSGDLAQNLIYQTISMYLLFFYTNVYGLDPAIAAVMFLIVRIVDVIWDPIVGTLSTKITPSWKIPLLSDTWRHSSDRLCYPVFLERLFRLSALCLYHIRRTFDVLHPRQRTLRSAKRITNTRHG